MTSTPFAPVAVVEPPAPCPEAPPSALPGPTLSVIIPTLNERDNITELVDRLDRVLGDIAWEVIFVDDDSTDDTALHIRAIARTDGRVRCLHRIGRRGLSSACIEGFLASTAPYVAVMDADMQHDETLLPAMLGVLEMDEADVVIGSRFVSGGSVADWDSSRLGMSRLATLLSRLLVKSTIHDPMSGFFMLRRDVVDLTVRRLSGLGFKILLDILSSAPDALRIREVPYVFGLRRAGESKLDSMVALEYLLLLLDKLIGHIVPIRFLLFSLVGVTGLVVHLTVLTFLHRLLGLDFWMSQLGATLVAMTNNFFLNNILTYRDRRLKGWSLLSGLLTFVAVCSVGAVANIGVAEFIYQSREPWWLAGIAGALIGAVWNYAATSFYTWGRRRPQRGGGRRLPLARTGTGAG